MYKMHLKVKGFEDPLLTEALDDALDGLEQCIDWVRKQWLGLMEWGEDVSDAQHTEEHMNSPGPSEYSQGCVTETSLHSMSTLLAGCHLPCSHRDSQGLISKH